MGRHFEKISFEQFKKDVSDDKKLYEAIDNKEFGYDTNGLVVVQYPNAEKISAIKMIEKHMRNMSCQREVQNIVLVMTFFHYLILL